MSALSLEEVQRIKQATKEINPPDCSGGIAIYKCPLCGKRFVVTDTKQWVFKRQIHKNYAGKYIYLCSYGCVQKMDYAYGIK